MSLLVIVCFYLFTFKRLMLGSCLLDGEATKRHDSLMNVD